MQLHQVSSPVEEDPASHSCSLAAANLYSYPRLREMSASNLNNWLFFIIFGAANVYIFVVLSLLFSKAINKQLGYVWSVFVGLLVEQLLPKSTLQIQSEAICQMYSEGK